MSIIIIRTNCSYNSKVVLLFSTQLTLPPEPNNTETTQCGKNHSVSERRRAYEPTPAPRGKIICLGASTRLTPPPDPTTQKLYPVRLEHTRLRKTILSLCA